MTDAERIARLERRVALLDDVIVGLVESSNRQDRMVAAAYDSLAPLGDRLETLLATVSGQR